MKEIFVDQLVSIEIAYQHKCEDFVYTDTVQEYSYFWGSKHNKKLKHFGWWDKSRFDLYGDTCFCENKEEVLTYLKSYKNDNINYMIDNDNNVIIMPYVIMVFSNNQKIYKNFNSDVEARNFYDSLKYNKRTIKI